LPATQHLCKHGTAVTIIYLSVRIYTKPVPNTQTIEIQHFNKTNINSITLFHQLATIPVASFTALNANLEFSY